VSHFHPNGYPFQGGGVTVLNVVEADR